MTSCSKHHTVIAAVSASSVFVFVAIAVSGFLLILLVTVIVVSGYCYYHKKIKKAKKGVHTDLEPFQRLEHRSDILLHGHSHEI